METIAIPGSVEALTGLAVARGWERAAWVWAFTELGQGKRTDLGGNAPRLTLAEFAALGLPGLRDKHTVARYRAAWQSAIDNGDACSVAPGDQIDVPDLPFPKVANATVPRRTVDEHGDIAAPFLQALTGKNDIDPDLAAVVVVGYEAELSDAESHAEAPRVRPELAPLDPKISERLDASAEQSDARKRRDPEMVRLSATVPLRKARKEIQESLAWLTDDANITEHTAAQVRELAAELRDYADQLLAITGKTQKPNLKIV